MKKFDIGYFYYSFVSSLGSALVVTMAFVNIISDEEADINLPLALIAYGVVYIAFVVYAWLYVRASGYEVGETELRCKRGVLFRKTSVLSYTKVHAVNKKQGLIQRLFGIAVLTVDSGATSNAFSAEITIIEKTATVDRLMTQIKQLQEGRSVATDTVEDEPQKAEEKQNLYTFTSKLKMAYSAITLCSTLLCILALGVVGVVLFATAIYILRSGVRLDLGEAAIVATFIAVIILVLSSIISFIGGAMTSFFGYHNFKIFRNRDDVEVNYGLFVRNTNNFKFNRIKAVKINQGPIKKLFGFASAGLEVVGYGVGSNDNENNNSAAPGVLLPLCKANEINGIIGKILPQYVPEKIENKAKSYPAFILWIFFGIIVTFVSVFALAFIVMTVAAVKSDIIIKAALLSLLALAVVLLCIAIFAVFQYKNAGLTIGEDKLTLQNGIIVKNTTVIRKRDLIAIEKITTPLRSKNGIYSYKIHFFTNAFTNTVLVKNLDESLGAELEDFLKY